MLRAAVNSVVGQELPPGWQMELIVSVSDPRIQSDVDASISVAVTDSRIRVALSTGRGAAATRNAGIAEARGSVFAFMDDDCEAQPGWLVAGLAAIGSADLVQGATRPMTEVPRYHHSVWVSPPSWLWETCNLLVRRQFVERVGGFNETWNQAGRRGNLFQFGEDAEIGWKMVRAGARPNFAPDAVVYHAVVPRGHIGFLAYKAGIRRFPRLFRTTPEVRRVFYHGYFVNRRHVALTLCAALGLGSLVARKAHRDRASVALGASALVAYLAPAGPFVRRRDITGAVEELARQLPEETVEFVSALYGSIRWQRLLL